MVDIQSRMSEVYPSDVQKAVYKMVEKGDLIPTGANRNRRYLVHKKNK